jgi:hypothetical protein
MAQGTTKGVPIDTDPLLAADSDLLVPSQKAIKTYVDNSNVNQVETSRSISTTAPLAGGGDLSADRTLSITQATTSTDGYLSSTDWNTFNNKGYTLTVTSTAGNLSTGQTYYFGNLGRVPQLNAPDISRVYIPKTGVIKKAYIVHGSTSTGTITSITVSIRLNNTTDTLVAVSTANALFRTYINNSLSINVSEGDYIEIKVTSVSAAAPASNSFSGTLYIE